jgi:hypothetical protein
MKIYSLEEPCINKRLVLLSLHMTTDTTCNKNLAFEFVHTTRLSLYRFIQSFQQFICHVSEIIFAKTLHMLSP